MKTGVFMKVIKKCPLLLLLAVSGILLTLAGAVGRNSIYKSYPFNPVTTPYLALVMKGLGDGVRPFDAPEYRQLSEGVRKAVKSFGGLGGDGDTTISGGLAASAMKGNAGGAIIIPPPGEASASQNDSAENSSAPGVSDNAAAGAGTETYEFQTVTEDYFNDAVFIGDSRTQGLFEYGGMEERADFFSRVSLTIYNVLTEPIVDDEETGKKITVEEALQKKQYGKVYLMLGINELGTGTTESFMKEYKKVVARLRELQPDAVLFVEGIMRVTGTKNETDPIFNNTNINDKNNEIEKLADNRNIFYIDVNEAVCDENGGLNEEYTGDDVHLKAQYYSIWKEFLMEHGIVR